MQLNNYILKNAKVFTKAGFIQTEIKVTDGVITELGTNLTGTEEIDLAGKIITPGFIDVHVHLREPGFEYKEDIKTGSYSAVKGGYSHIMAMPNTRPCMDDVETIEHFNQLVKEKAYNNVLTFSAISENLRGENLVDFSAINQLAIAGFSDDGKGVQTDAKMLETLKQIEAMDSILSLHCEDEAELGEVMGCVNEGEVSRRLNLGGINNASEWKMIKRDLKLMAANNVNCRYHVCHISARESVDLIKEAQLKGMNVSGEVSPHHLILNEEDIQEKDPNFKMNPPLRSKLDQKRLIDGLNEGTLAIIATDHAPHSKDEKNKEIEKAPFGIIGLDFAFASLYTKLVKSGIVELETILKAMTYNPAERFKIDHEIKVGNAANLTVIDLNDKTEISEEKLGSKASNTPFINQTMDSKVVMTIVGNRTFDWRKDEE